MMGCPQRQGHSREVQRTALKRASGEQAALGPDSPPPKGPAQEAPGQMLRGHKGARRHPLLAGTVPYPGGRHSCPLTALHGSLLLEGINRGTAKEGTSQSRLPRTQSRAAAGPHTAPHSPQHPMQGLGAPTLMQGGPGLDRSSAPPLSPAAGAAGGSLRPASQPPELTAGAPPEGVLGVTRSGGEPGSEPAPR